MAQRNSPTRQNLSFEAGANLGVYPGITTVHTFGHNEAVPNGSWATIWHATGLYSWPVTAETVRIKVGGNAADTAEGNGAREITVIGLDENWDPVSETIDTAGASASAPTTALFFRILRAYVSAVGVYGAANTGVIQVENTTSATVVGYLDTDEGQTQQAIYTVPAGYSAFIQNIRLTASANKVTNIKLIAREDADVFTGDMKPFRVVHDWNAIAGPSNLHFSAFFVFTEKTDLEFQVFGDGAVSKVSVSFDVILVKN